jgi:hypothetical protein
MLVVSGSDTKKRTSSISWLELAVPILALLGIAISLMPMLVNSLPASDDFLNHVARCFIIMKHGTDPLLDSRSARL